MFLFTPQEESNRKDYSAALVIVSLVMLVIGLGVLIDTVFDIIKLSSNPHAFVIETLFKKAK